MYIERCLRRELSKFFFLSFGRESVIVLIGGWAMFLQQFNAVDRNRRTRSDRILNISINYITNYFSTSNTMVIKYKYLHRAKDFY